MAHPDACPAATEDAQKNSRRVPRSCDPGERPSPIVGQEVVRDVVDRVVLNRDHTLLTDGLLHDALPCEEAREGDDERRHADQGDERALERADRGTNPDGEQDRDQARDLIALLGLLEQRHGHAANAADVADGEIDLAEQQDEDDPHGDDRHAGHLDDDVVEVDRRDVVRVFRPEVERDQRQPNEDRQNAHLAAAEPLEISASEREDRFPFLAAGVGGCRFGLDRRQTGAGSDSSLPAAFAGAPTVIASTIAC